MDYKTEIMKMLDEIEDLDLLKKIFTFISTWLKVTKE